MTEDQPISQWLGAVKEGVDRDAEQGLWEEYFQRLVALARVKLGSIPKACEDDEDVAISAMKSFFRRVRIGQFPNLNDRTELWPLLVQTTIWKVNNFHRRYTTKERDFKKEISADWLKENDPTAELADKVIEEGNALLESLTDEKLRTVAQLRLEGYSNVEIAEETGRSVKTVEWRLQQIRKHLKAQLGLEDDRGQHSR